MAAPKGQQFWKLRTKHGRDALFTDSKVLWDNACDYFAWCDKNPWIKVEQLKKPFIETLENGKTKLHTVAELPTARPYTIRGLCLFLDVNETYWRQFKETKTAQANDFPSVISRIEDVIYTQKFEGAAVGAFNANIISRDLGLVDKTDLTSDGKPLVPYEYVDSKGNVMRW